MNFLPPFAPPSYESVDDFLGIKPSKSSETNHERPSDPPPEYEEKTGQTERIDESETFEYIIAQNQVTLVHNNPDRTIIDQIDTEPYLSIRQIREYLCQKLNANTVNLSYKNTALDNDNLTLADYGWRSGECGTIIVRTDAQPNTRFVI